MSSSSSTATPLSNDPRIFKTAEDAQKFYNDLKFDVASEGFTRFNKQCVTAEGGVKCAFCEAREKILGIKINDNEKKTQVVASICPEHNQYLKDLPQKDIELAEVQNMIRFFFPESADTIIRQFYMLRKQREFSNSAFLEFMNLVKWSVEEQMLMVITNARPPCETPGYTRCCSEDKCVLCGEKQTATYEIFSPIKQCWLNMEVCDKCHHDLSAQARDMEYEIRTMYFEKFETVDELPKRLALQIFSDQIKKFHYKVLFCDPWLDLERVKGLLHIAGIDKEHSLLLVDPDSKPKEEEQKEKKDDENEK